MPADHRLRVHTDVRFRGRPVTVGSDDLTHLVAIAGYGSDDEVLLAAFTLDGGNTDEPYRLQGGREAFRSLRDAARFAVDRLELTERQRGT